MRRLDFERPEMNLDDLCGSARGRMRRPYVSRNQHPRVSHLFLHLQWLLHVRPAAAVPVFPGGVAWVVSALFFVIFNLWRWLFTLLGEG